MNMLEGESRTKQRRLNPMSGNDDTRINDSNTRTLYGNCEVFYDRTFTRLAKDFPISTELPELGQNFSYQPALSHYNPDEPWRINRLEQLHALMVAELFHGGNLPLYEAVLSLHDHKGTLVLVVESRAEPGDVKVLCNAACWGWEALNECYIALVFRNGGHRPRPRRYMGPTPFDEPSSSQFIE